MLSQTASKCGHLHFSKNKYLNENFERKGFNSSSTDIIAEVDKLDGNNMIVYAIITDKNTMIYGLTFLRIEKIQLKRQKLQAIFNFLSCSYMIYNLSKLNFIFSPE
jgi:glutathione peroxidase-family protein